MAALAPQSCASISAARQAAIVSADASKTHEPSPASGPVRIERSAAPLVIEAYVSTGEGRMPPVGQEVLVVYSDAQEPGVTSLRAIMRKEKFLAQLIGYRHDSEAYDNTEDHFA